MIFKKLQARYGTKWIASIEGIEELAAEEWSQGLSGLSGKDIKHGLDKWQEEWPPCMSEFVTACKDIMPACHREFPKLEVLMSDKETAAKHIQELKQKLKRG